MSDAARRIWVGHSVGPNYGVPNRTLRALACEPLDLRICECEHPETDHVRPAGYADTCVEPRCGCPTLRLKYTLPESDLVPR